jgi:hypothetical protein
MKFIKYIIKIKVSAHPTVYICVENWKGSTQSSTGSAAVGGARAPLAPPLAPSLIVAKDPKEKKKILRNHL